MRRSESSQRIRSVTQQRGCPQKRKGKPLTIEVHRVTQRKSIPRPPRNPQSTAVNGPRFRRAPPLPHSLRQGGNTQIRETPRNSAADPARDPVLFPKSRTRCGYARSSQSLRRERSRHELRAAVCAQNLRAISSRCGPKTQKYLDTRKTRLPVSRTDRKS